jgi:hexokinase
MSRPTVQQEKQLEGIENDIASTLSALEATQVILRRTLRTEADVQEAQRIIQAVQAIRTRAIERRKEWSQCQT